MWRPPVQPLISAEPTPAEPAPLPAWLLSPASTSAPSAPAEPPKTPTPELAGNPTPAPFVPYAPPASAPQAPATPAPRPLTAPIHERQPDEPAVAWHAFQGFLAPGAGGTTPGRADGPAPGVVGNWAEAGAWIAESRREVLEAMSVEWSWEARRAAQDAAKAAKTPSAEVRAQRAEARRLQAIVTDLAILEFEKLIREAKDTPAMRLGVKEAIALFGRVANVEVMRERAGILESLSAGANNAPAINWDALTDDELEAYRTLRDKAGV